MKLSLAVIATAIQDFEKRSVFPCFHIYNDNDNDYTDYGSSVFSEIVSILRLLSFPWDLILHSSREMYCKPLREMIGKCRRASPM